METIYKWDTPHQWLMEKVFEWDKQKLIVQCAELANHIDPLTIKNMYKSEMKEDGYFETILKD